MAIVKVKEYQSYNGEEIILDDNITEIQDEAFIHSYNLKNIVLPEKLERVGDDAFHNCTSLK